MNWSEPTPLRLSRLPNGRTAAGDCAGRMMVELGLWIMGVVLMATYLVATSGLERERKQGIELFTQAQASASASHRLEELPLAGQTEPIPVEQALDTAPDPVMEAVDDALPIAVLRIASLGLEVPVYPDLTELNLSRGAGWVGGTAAPHTGGNMAIAAHRDQYFRPLKDIQVGDTMELESLAGRSEFRVSRISIVDPDDVSVLDDTAVSTITLVTCYPFYFIGNAPQRYIVQAVAVDQPGNVSMADAIPTAPPSGETP